MKKTLFIILCILVILIVLGTWVYLVLYGPPKEVTNRDFTNFDIIGNDREIREQDSIDVDSGTSMDARRFWKIDTRPVVGAQYTQTHIRYVEVGTGHIYEYDLSTHKETLISATTIPKAVRAVFSNDASIVAITAITNAGYETIIGEVISEGKINTITLPFGAREIHVSASGEEVFYILQNDSGARGYSYNLLKRTSSELFSIPLRDVRIVWGSPLYVYTTPSYTQSGFVYEVKNGRTLEFISSGMPGLLVFRYGEGITVSSTRAGTYRALDKVGVEQSIPIIPEKCVGDDFEPEKIICAAPENSEIQNFPDEWYMGVSSFKDVLWELDTTTGEAVVLINLYVHAKENIDVIDMGSNFLGIMLYLINKNDNSLWLFDRSI